MKQFTYNRIKSSLLFSIAAVLTAATVSSCQKDEVDVVDLTAYVADDYASSAKVSIDASQFACWETGDEVNVNGETYPVTVSGSYKTATIVGVEKNDDSYYTAVYPASCAGVVTPGSTTVDITLPSTQTWDASHIFSPMVATYNGSQLNFHNPCNLLAVTVTNKTGSTLMVHSIIVESTVNNITGTFTVSGCNGENPTTAYTGSDGGKTITLDCGNQSIDNSAIFYVAVPKVEGEIFHFSVNAKTVVNTTTTKYTFAKNSRSLTIMNNQFVPITVATDDAAVTNDPYFWGKGSDTYPYLITDYNDLKSLSYVVHNATDDAKYNAANRYYLQTGNFTITDANWGSSDRLAVGSTTNAFKANYDGGNHTISFYGVTSAESSYPVGVFGVVRGGASISNLTVAGSIDLGDSYGDVDAGGVAGKATGKVTFSSCTNQATVTSTYTTAADYGVGGICGAVDATDSTVTFTSCTNSAQIKAYGLKNGGIVGFNSNGTMSFSNCTNSGNIVSYDGSSTYYDYCGGIVGQVNTTQGNININGCTNNGNISGNSYVGGIVGSCCHTTASNDSIYFISCSNNATVSGNGNNVGGIVGFTENKPVSIKSCVNTVYGVITGVSYVGGILGCRGDNNINLVRIYGTTTNSGKITGDSGNGVGGIAGKVNSPTTVSGASNISAEVEGSYNVGGIIGYVSGNCSFTNCSNSGAIKASSASSNSSGIGGILGKTNTGTIFFDHCCNTQAIDVSAASGSGIYIGGIIGYNNGGGTIRNCYNKGTLDGPGYTMGGIYGGSTATSITVIIANCFNKGNMTGTINQGAAGIAGHCRNASNYPIKINNCYSSGSISGSAYYKRSIAVKYNGTIYVFNCYGPTSITNFSDYATGFALDCAKFNTYGNLFQISNGTNSRTVRIHLLNSTGVYTSDENTYATLQTALAAWAKDNGSNYLSWNSDVYPEFSNW